MGRVERHVYDETLEGILYTLGLDARGVAASAGWELDTAVLRAGIRRLRAVCTHPQVGQLQRQQGEKTVKAPLKTMEQVLEVRWVLWLCCLALTCLQSMRDQNWKSTMDDRKSKVSARSHIFNGDADMISRSCFSSAKPSLCSNRTATRSASASR